MNDSPTVFLVGADQADAAILSSILRLSGMLVKCFVTVDDFLDADTPPVPGCVVMDVAAPGSTVIGLQHAMSDRHSDLPVVYVSGQGSIEIVAQAMKAGAFDFLAKPVDAGILVGVVRNALEANSANRASRLAMDAVQCLIATLTPREREVLPLVAAGALNKQIAARLGTGEKTIKVHRSRVMHKLHVRTVPDLVRLADRAGLHVVPFQTASLAAARPLDARVA